jgi:hypothetical protein
MKLKWIVPIAASMLLLGSCGSEPTLITKPAAVPVGLDLTGDWIVRTSSGISQPESRDLAVHVFLKTGKTLKLTQTVSALFISFDRSVVEEYRFGENRDISIGEITAERASGWENNAYLIETLDDDNAKLIDTYRLEDAGEHLVRTMVIYHRSRKLIDLRVDYDRVWQ